MKRETIYGALIAGVLLSAPVLSPAVAFADEDEATTSVDVSEVIDFDQDETTTPVDVSEGIDLDEDGTGDVPNVGDTGKLPQSQAGPKYGPNIDGWVVKVTNAGGYWVQFFEPSFSDNIASMNPARGKIQKGETGTVKGKQSATSVIGAKEPANMNFKAQANNAFFDIKVRDTQGYSTPADVSCNTSGSGGKCTVTSNAKNKEILISISTNS